MAQVGMITRREALDAARSCSDLVGLLRPGVAVARYNLSCNALQTLSQAPYNCPFCNNTHLDRHDRCANCGAPDGERL